MFISDVLRDRAQTIAKDAKDSSPEPLMLSVMRMHESATASAFKGVWRIADLERETTSKKLPGSVFLSLESYSNVARKCLRQKNGRGMATDDIFAEHMLDAMWHIAFSSAWRQTRRIYRFDETFLSELTATPIERAFPRETALSMPDYCLVADFEKPLSLRGEAEMFGCMSIPLLCPDGDVKLLSKAVIRTADGVVKLLTSVGPTSACPEDISGYRCRTSPEIKESERCMRDITTAILSTAMYLSSEKPDVENPFLDDVPTVARIKRKETSTPKNFSGNTRNDRSAVVNTGYRIGAVLRAARSHTASGMSKSEGRHGGTLIPHARGGHWHRFWTGPLDGDRRLKIKWLPPTIINAHLVRDELTAAVLGTKSPENAKTDEVCAPQER